MNDLKIECQDKTKNASMRAAIWKMFKDDLQLKETPIEISKGDTKEDKQIKMQCLKYIKTIVNVGRSSGCFLVVDEVESVLAFKSLS